MTPRRHGIRPATPPIGASFLPAFGCWSVHQVPVVPPPINSPIIPQLCSPESPSHVRAANLTVRQATLLLPYIRRKGGSLNLLDRHRGRLQFPPSVWTCSAGVWCRTRRSPGGCSSGASPVTLQRHAALPGAAWWSSPAVCSRLGSRPACFQAWFQARLQGVQASQPPSILCLSVQALSNVMGTLVVQEQAGCLGLSNLGRGVTDWTCQSSSGVFGPAVSRPKRSPVTTYKCCSSQPDLALHPNPPPVPLLLPIPEAVMGGEPSHQSQTCTSTCACCPRGWK